MSNFSPKPLAWPEFGCPMTAWRGGEVRGKTPIQVVPLESVRDWRSRPPSPNLEPQNHNGCAV